MINLFSYYSLIFNRKSVIICDIETGFIPTQYFSNSNLKFNIKYLLTDIIIKK